MSVSKQVARLGAVGLAATLALTLSGCGNSGSDGGAQPFQIGIAQIMSHPSLDSIREGFKQGMTDAGLVEGTDVVYDEQNPQGDQAALTSIANNFASAKKDLVMAITTPVAISMAQVITDTPVIFAGVTDPVGAGLIDSLEAPGGNLTGTSDYPPIEQQIQLILDVKPDTKVIGIVYSSSEVNSELQTNLAKEAAEKLGLEVRTATVTNTNEVAQAANSLAGVDAFYVGNDNTVVSGIEGLVQAAETQQVPVITADPDSVARGATAAYAVDQYKMGYEAAGLAVKVLKEGADPASLATLRMADLGELELTISTTNAANVGLTIPDAVVQRADHQV